MDQAKAALGLWPYRCEDCGLRFHARGRSLAEIAARDAAKNKRKAKEETRTRTKDYAQASSEDQAAAMAFRTDSVKPHAKVVISADTHEQLNHILLALDRAVSSYQQQSEQAPQEDRAYSGRY